MKKGWYIVIGLVVASIVLLIVKLKQWTKEIVYGVADIPQLLKIGVNEVRVMIPVYIYNPSPFEVIVSNLDLKIYFDGYFLATVKTPGNYSIKPKSNSTYPLTFSVATGQILKYLGERGYVINDPDWLSKVKVTVDGTVTADIGLLKLKDKNVRLDQSLKDYVK